MDELTEEFYQLKLSLSPILSFLEDISALRRARHISEESSLTMLGLMNLNIKEDVLSAVRALQIEEEARIDELQNMLKDTQKEIRDKFYDYSQAVTNLEMDIQNFGDLIARQGSFIEGQNKNFDKFKKDISERASAKELLDIKKSLKHYTPIGEFNLLSNQVSEFANKSTVDVLKKELHKIEKKIKIYITTDELNSAIAGSNEKTKKYFIEKFVQKMAFEEEKIFSVKRLDRIDDDVKVLFEKIETTNDLFKKKFKELFELVKKKPWTNDLNLLQAQIDECSTKTDFLRLQDMVTPKINNFTVAIIEFSEKIGRFEKVLERYDEILLEKASKDDVSIINSKLPNFSTINMYKELSNNFSKQVETNFDKFRQVVIKADEMHQAFQILSQRFDQIRKENYEVSSISSTLTHIGEKLTEKADKSDIYLIYDVMGRKEEISSIKESDLQFKKQLETSVIIMHSLCRTMLKSGESPAATRKQRFDLYRNLTNLIAWINGEEMKDPHITPSNRSPVNIKTEFDLETYKDLLASARLTRRFRRDVMTTSPKNKTLMDFSNLPPLV